MIETLSIKNFAVIEDLTLEFSAGINALTGETGAGKSVILEAIRFLFGATSGHASMLRQGTTKLEVSAQIEDIPATSRRELKELEIDTPSDEITLRRIFDASTNRARAWINDTPVTLTTLQGLGSSLLEIHEQGSQTQVKESGFALYYLDRWANLWDKRATYEDSFHDFQEARQALENHQKFVLENSAKKEFLKFQLEELNAAKLDPDTQNRIAQELPLWMNKEKNIQALTQLDEILSGESANVSERLGQAQVQASKINEEAAGNLALAQTHLEEALNQLAKTRQQLEFDPRALEELLTLKAKRDRLIQKYALKDTADLTALQSKVEDELNRLENAQVLDLNLKRDFEDKKKKASSLAAEISIKRNKKSGELGSALTQEIQALGLARAQIQVQVITDFENLNPQGADQVKFLFAPNPGEGFKELGSIASGGETSRIALALKALIARGSKTREMALLIFDEIEQGLSAQAAKNVAQKIKELAASRQIIVITHSPMLAATSQTHFAVSKKIEVGRTKTIIEKLENSAAKRQEILRLLGAANSSQKKSLEPFVSELLAAA